VNLEPADKWRRSFPEEDLHVARPNPSRESDA
jgi:hypothetical protein